MFVFLGIIEAPDERPDVPDRGFNPLGYEGGARVGFWVEGVVGLDEGG